MAGPIVFISRYQIVHGQREALAAAFSQVVPAIASTKPRTALFAAYIDVDGSEVRFIHAFPDANAMRAHFEGARERAQSVGDLMRLAVFEVYGPADPESVAELRDSAQAGGAVVEWLPNGLGGFLRAPA